MGKKILYFLFFLGGINSYAQQVTCGFDFQRSNQYNKESKLKLLEQNFNSVLFSKATQASRQEDNANGVIQIPVVVHVIHENGPENISDSLIQAAINQLNLRFQNANPYYDSTGTAINIQFCLASIDPQGNSSTGITRDSSALTNLWGSDDVLMKNLNRWDPDYYFNIWTVKSIYGFNISVAGYSSFPTNAGDSTDGVVVQYGYLNNNVLTHESGHYLGLYHTFNSMDCANRNCFLEGDMVCDTPPDTSMSMCMGNSCSTDADDTTGFSPFITDVNDLPNYMDYTSCPNSFSQGQGDRMVNSTTLFRTGLLQSNGCGFTGGAAPVAQINFNISPCNDGLVYFSDSMCLNYTTVNWDFDNNGVYESFAHQPTYVFPATGNYTIKLLVTGPGGIDSVFQTLFVQKAPSLYYPIVVTNGIFQDPDGRWKSCANFTINFSSAPAQSYLWSTGDTTQSISFVPDSIFTLTLSIVDSAGLTWTNQICHPILVYVYPLPPEPTIYSDDSLNICDGDLVTFHSIVNGTGNYTYNWYQNSSQVSGAHDSLFTAAGYFPGVPYQLILGDTAGCYNYSNVVYVYSYSPPAVQSLSQNFSQLISGWGGGNQWLLDGIPIPGETGTTFTVVQPGCYSVEWFNSFAPACSTLSDTICFTIVGLEELHNYKNAYTVFPVPSSREIYFETSVTMQETQYTITDPFGRIVRCGSFSTGKSTIDISLLRDGIYFLHFSINNERIARKFIKN
ncbi:MAG: T9SS type A sorting domain-containing protein [Bacteroidetes bacterium]|nr:T9SS type A sorting domain-containing protein [Bacteroidota bacterium]